MNWKHTGFLALAIFIVATLAWAGVTNFGSVTLEEDLIVGDDATITGAATIGETLTVTGEFTISDDLVVGNGTPDITLNGEDAYIEGTLEVDGATRLDGALDLNATLAVSDTATFTVQAALQSGFDIPESIPSGIGDHSMESSDDLVFTMGAAADVFTVETGNFAVGDGSGDVAMDGEDGYVEGTFEVDGAARFDGALDLNSTLDVANTATFTVQAAMQSGFSIPVDKSSTVGAYTVEDDNDSTGNLLITVPSASECVGIVTGNFSIGDPSGADQTIDGEDFFVAGLAEIDGLLDCDGGIEVDGKLDVSDAEDGGASNGSIVKKTLQAGETYTGSTAGLMIKSYDTDNTVVHDGGEFTGLYVNVKQHSAMTNGGKSSLATLHNYPGDVDVDFGVRIFGDCNEDAIQITGGTSDVCVAMSNQTCTSADIEFQNGETILNSPDGTLDFGAANLTTSGTITGSGVLPSGPLVVASAGDTACDTTCGSEANCAFGQNTGDMALVDCDGATADVCFCYSAP